MRSNTSSNSINSNNKSKPTQDLDNSKKRKRPTCKEQMHKELDGVDSEGLVSINFTSYEDNREVGSVIVDWLEKAGISPTINPVKRLRQGIRPVCVHTQQTHSPHTTSCLYLTTHTYTHLIHYTTYHLANTITATSEPPTLNSPTVHIPCLHTHNLKLIHFTDNYFMLSQSNNYMINIQRKSL